MQPTLIVLRGPADAGKTTTIRLVWAMLGGKELSTVEIRGQWLPWKGKKIGFVSPGEIVDRMETYFKRLGDDCAVVVTATRTVAHPKVRTPDDFIDSLDVQNGGKYVVKRLTKNRIGTKGQGSDPEIQKSRNRSNQQKAEEIVKEIEMAISA